MAQENQEQVCENLGEENGKGSFSAGKGNAGRRFRGQSGDMNEIDQNEKRDHKSDPDLSLGEAGRHAQQN